MLRLTRLLSFVVVVAFFLSTAADVQARRMSKKKRWNKLVKQAQSQYQKEQYNEAAETLLKAYDLRPVAKLLYNSARAYEKAGDDDQAMRFYQRYIDAEDTDPELLRNAATKLASLREARARKELEQKQQLKDEKRKAEIERQKLADERQRIIEEEKARKIEAERQRKLKEEQAKMGMVLPISAYSLLGLGSAGLATGVVFGILATLDKGLWDSSLDLTTRQAARDAAQFKAMGADISYALGAVITLTGGGLLTFHLLRADDEKNEDLSSENANPPAPPEQTVQDKQTPPKASESQVSATRSAKQTGAAQ